MNKSRKRYSVTGTLDTLSTKDPSQIQSLKKLNANILNYIKNKGIKYHDITNKSFQQINNNNTKITPIKEENEEINQNKNHRFSPVHRKNPKSILFKEPLESLEEKKKFRSNSLKLISKKNLMIIY